MTSRYTYTVTECSFPETGVVRWTEVARGLTRRQVVERFGDGVEFFTRSRKTESRLLPSHVAEPEWRMVG